MKLPTLTIMMTFMMLSIGFAIISFIDYSSAQTFHNEINQTKACVYSIREHASRDNPYMFYALNTKQASQEIWEKYNCESLSYTDDFGLNCSGQTGFKMIGEPFNIFYCGDLDPEEVDKNMKELIK